jgi:hypothetical protein
MKLTFKKLDGTISEKEIDFSQPIGKSLNVQKDLFYFIDLEDSYKVKCCKLSRINKSKTDEKVLMIIENLKQY